jgi:hypothetical protein
MLTRVIKAGGSRVVFMVIYGKRDAEAQTCDVKPSAATRPLYRMGSADDDPNHFFTPSGSGSKNLSRQNDAMIVRGTDRIAHDKTSKTKYQMTVSRKENQGLCLCDDCGKEMRWGSVDGSLLNALFLLCSVCTCRWFEENRYHPDVRMQSVALRKLSAMA